MLLLVKEAVHILLYCSKQVAVNLNSLFLYRTQATFFTYLKNFTFVVNSRFLTDMYFFHFLSLTNIAKFPLYDILLRLPVTNVSVHWPVVFFAMHLKIKITEL